MKEGITKKDLMKNAKGIWVVYDLEANSKIQTLLEKDNITFWFIPNFKMLKEQK